MGKPVNGYVAEGAPGGCWKLQEVGPKIEEAACTVPPEKWALEELSLLLALIFGFLPTLKWSLSLETGSYSLSALNRLRPQGWRQPSTEGNFERHKAKTSFFL